MKRKTLLALAVLLTALACLFTSCSNSVEPPRAEEYGYVTFGNGSSRSLSTEYGIKSYDELYWYYTAVKKDSYGLTGQKLTQTEVPAKTEDGKGIGSGTVGPFSQGAWEFELFAYDAARTGTEADNLVYQGKSAIIVLKGGETKAVPVSVSLQGDSGLINVSQAYFEWANGSDATGQIYVTIELTPNTSTGSPYFFGPLTRSSDKYTFGTSLDSFTVPSDYYTCTVNAYMLEDVIVPLEGSKTVKSDATPLATQTFGLRVYGNATTYIKGNLTEGLFADVVFKVAEQDMKVFVPTLNGSAEITDISVTPSGTGKTSVSFSNGALSGVPNDAQLQLDVNVTPIESANEKFNIVGVVTNNKSAFAGIDITLIQTTSDGNSAPVDSFNNNSSTTATVTTYIATGLSNVVVKYAGNPNEDIDSTYDSESGLLTFTTSHFSEYYVLADCKIVNVTTNVGYPSFIDGYKNANDGDVLVLYSDKIEFPETLSQKENVTIRGRSHSNKTIVSGLKNIDKLMKNLVLENLDFIQTSTLNIQGSNIVFNNCDFSARETSYSSVPEGLKNGYYTDITTIKNAENIVFNGCNFSGIGKDYELPYARLIASPACTNLTINNSKFKDCFSAIYYSCVNGVLEVNSSEFNCYAYTVHCGGDTSCELLVSDSTLNGWTSFASSTNTNASFSNCSFGRYKSGYHCMVPYMNTTFDECVFDSGYEIYNRYDTRKSMNFDNCKKGDIDLTKDNFKDLFRNEEDQETVYLWNRSVCYVNGSPVEKDPAKIEKEVKGKKVVYFFKTLEDAVRAANNGDTITLLDNSSGNGIGLYVNGDDNSKIKTKNITIDFNNYTYTIDGSLQGSTGTVSQAFHLEKDCSVTLKNGTITSEKAAMLIQNYCNLTLDNMCLVFGRDYPLSNNAGNIIIKDTTITAKDGNGIAFDVYSFGGYSKTTVTVEGNSVINGKIELNRENSASLRLVINGGEFNNEISQKVSDDCVVEIKGGSFSSNPSSYLAKGYFAYKDGDKWQVGQKAMDVSFGNAEDAIKFCADCYNNPDTNHSAHNIYLTVNNGVAEVKRTGAWVKFSNLDWENKRYVLEYDVDLSDLNDGCFVAFDSGETKTWQDNHLGFKKEGSSFVAYNTLFTDKINDTYKIGEVGENVHITYTYSYSVEDEQLTMKMEIVDGANSYSIEKTVGSFNTEASLCWDVYTVDGESSIYAKLDNFVFGSIDL